MNRRQMMMSLIAGEYPGETPQWIMALTSLQNAKKLIPEHLLYEGYYLYPQDGSYPFSPMGEGLLTKQVKFNEYIDRCAFPIGWGANAAFGHGGPGEFNPKIIEKSTSYFIAEYETGVKWKVYLDPYYVQIFDHPVKTEEDLERLVLPNPNDSKRYEGFESDVKWAKAHGEWTVGFVNGIFSSIHYFVRDYQDFFVDLLLNEPFAMKMIGKIAQWTITVVENMCRAGVDCIGFCDDLGSGTSLLISPDTYRKMIMPWHKELCETVHRYGAVVHMHSHGAIVAILKDIAETGIDMLNPVDPNDRMPLEDVREAIGPKVVLCGGMDKHFFDWERDVQIDYLKWTINTGRKLGPFILMDSGGIPTNVTKDWFEWFLDISRKIRKGN